MNQSIQQEISRFSDLYHIFETVQKRGYLIKLISFFEEVYINEINFTQQRLKEVISEMEKQGQTIEYSTQLQRNIQIFKYNFDLIITSTANKVWNSIIQKFNIINDQNTINHKIQLSQQLQKERFTDQNQQKITLNQSNVSRSPSKSSTFKQLTIPFSEISAISSCSPTKFNKAQRQLDNSINTHSPGVGKYKTEIGDKYIRKTSPNATIGKSEKINWIDEKIQKEDSHSPGPIYNPVKTYCSKRLK